MTKKIVKWTLVALGVIVVLGGLYFAYAIDSMGKLFDSMGDCGMSVGPCRGQKIELSIDTLTVDLYIDIPDGRFAMTNTQDTLSPILIRLDKDDKTIWAVKLVTETNSCSLPMYQMTGTTLQNDEYGLRLTFFNESYAEPGIIYLTDNYNFEMMCLSPM